MTSPPGNDLAWRTPALGGAPGIVSASDPEVIVRVRNLAQLLNLVPYQLGFQPASGDMVVMGTVPPTNRVRLTLRWDLPDPDVPGLAAAHARNAVAALTAEGCTQVAVVGFGPDQLVAPSVTALREAAKEAGLKVWDLLRAEDGRYWSYRCTNPRCCPPEGTPYSPLGCPIATAYQAAGARVLASRDVLAATIAPATGAEAASMPHGPIQRKDSVLPSTLPASASASTDPRAYMQIADTVRQWLDVGMLQPGDKVTITDLAERYRVTRQTAARGLHVLEDEGRLKRFPGFGYAVQDTTSITGPGAAAPGGPAPGDGR